MSKIKIKGFRVKQENRKYSNDIYTLGPVNIDDGNGEGSLKTAGVDQDDRTLGQYSFSEGLSTLALGNYSHAQGWNTNTTVNGMAAHAEGNGTIASGSYSHVEGNLTRASGQASHAQNLNTIASSDNQTALGKYNIEDTNDRYAMIIGNGTANERSNAAMLDWDGNLYLSGQIKNNSGENIYNNNLKNLVDGSAEGSLRSINSREQYSSIIVESDIQSGNTKEDSTFTIDISSIPVDLRDSLSVFIHTSTSQDMSSATDYEPINDWTLDSSTPIISYIMPGNSEETEQTFFAQLKVQTDSYSLGEDSFSEGHGTKASGNWSHAEGLDSIASGSPSHAEGQKTKASGSWSHAEGQNTMALGNWSHAEGYHTTASGIAAHAEGNQTIASGLDSHAEGSKTEGSGSYSHVEGYSTVASGNRSHAEGSNTIASGNHSHAEGAETTASEYSSHAEGHNTTASMHASHAEGIDTTASEASSHAEGEFSTASGRASHTEGSSTEASGKYSHAQNLGTIAASSSQTALGKYNIEDSNNKYVVIIGNGTTDNARSNALTVDWNGNVVTSGTLMYQRKIYKEVRTLTSSTVSSIIFSPTDYTYDTGDENFLEIYINGLKLNANEYTTTHTNSKIIVALTTSITAAGNSDAIEMILRK